MTGLIWGNRKSWESVVWVTRRRWSIVRN